MSGAQHTPGPWEVTDALLAANGGLLIQQIDGDRKIIGSVGPSPVNGTSEYDLTQEDEANAHLYAAAPELLQALREAVDLVADGMKSPKGTVSSWLELIAKAEGRS